MSVIWKFPLPHPGDELTHGIPGHGEVVCVGLDPAGEPSVWLNVNQGAPAEIRTFSVVGTSHPFPPTWRPIGSYTDGPFVWHALEVLDR